MSNDLECDHTTDATSSKDVDIKLTTRRKLLVGAVSTPVVLAVSGRSALACTSDGSGCNHKGLSLAAWCSIYPGQGQRVTHSHAVNTGDACGKWPDHWKPKCKWGDRYTKCFTEDWPVPPCGSKTGLRGWDYNYYKYSSSYKYAYGVSQDDPDFANGSKLPSDWGAFYTGKSISQLLISGNELQRYMCTAYLNRRRYGYSYPVSDQDLKMLAYKNYRGRPLSDLEIVNFIKQTCA